MSVTSHGSYAAQQESYVLSAAHSSAEVLNGMSEQEVLRELPNGDGDFFGHCYMSGHFRVLCERQYKKFWWISYSAIGFLVSSATSGKNTLKPRLLENLDLFGVLKDFSFSDVPENF